MMQQYEPLSATENHFEDDNCTGEMGTGELFYETRRTSATRNEGRNMFLQFLGLEAVVFCFSIAFFSSYITIQDFYIHGICKNSYNLTDEICNNLTNYPIEEKQVEWLASKYAMWQTIIESGVPLIVCSFIAPWSDKNGNKPVILWTISGFALTYCMYTLFSYLPNTQPMYIMMSSLPVALSGGMLAFTISLSSYLATQTSEEERSRKITTLGLIFNIGEPIGLFLGAKVCKIMSFNFGFIMASTIALSSVVYGSIMVRERKPTTAYTQLRGEQIRLNTVGDYASHRCLCTDSAYDGVKNIFITCFKKRQGNKRRFICLLTMLICVHYLSFWGAYSYRFLYTRNKFGWNAQTYSNFSAIHSVIGILGGIMTISMTMKNFRFEDTTIGIVCCVSNLLSYLVFAFCNVWWMMYIGSIVAMFGTLITYVLRSMLSKCVSKDELGKLFCFVTCAELSMPFIGSYLYNFVFQNTVYTFPGAIYILSFALQIPILISFLYISYDFKSDTNRVRNCNYTSLSSSED